MQRLTYIDSAVEKRALSSADISRRRPSQHVQETRHQKQDQELYTDIAKNKRADRANGMRRNFDPSRRSLTDRIYEAHGGHGSMLLFYAWQYYIRRIYSRYCGPLEKYDRDVTGV